MIDEYSLSTHQPTNPNVHSSKDTLATLNLAFHADVTRGLVVSLARLANP